MADVNYTVDISDAVAKTTTLFNLNNQQVQSLEKVIQAALRYTQVGTNVNSTLEKQIITIKSNLDAAAQLTATYRMVNGGLEPLTANLQYNAKALEAQAKAAQKAADQMAKAEQRAKAAFEAKNLGPFLDMANRIQGTLTNLALYRGFNTITNSISESIQASRQFQKELALVQTVSQDVGVSTQTWAKGITDISNRLGLDRTQLTKGLNSVVQNQVARGPAALDVVNAGANLAKTTGSDTQASIEVLTEGLNAFGLGANRADEFAAKLFKTVDLGVVKIEQLNGTLGRVAFLANDLGVSFEEVFALLTTLTRNGVKTSDAMVLVANAFTKLTKPTKEFQAVLDSMGTPTGKLAIQANGLLGTLTKISDAVKAGKVDISEIAPEIRSQKAFTAFGQFQPQIESDLAQIKNSSQSTFEKAKSIVSETDVDKINRMAETLKNAFSAQFGDSINKAIVDVAKFMGGIEAVDGTLKGADSTVKTITKSAVAMAIGIGGVTLAIKGYNAASILLTKTNPFVAIGAVAAGFAAYQYFKPDKIEDTRRAIEEYNAAVAAQAPTKNLEAQAKAMEKIKEDVKVAAQGVSQKLAQAYTDVDKRLDSTNQKLKENRDSLKAAFVGVMDQAKNRLHDYERDLGRVNSEIQRLNKAQRNGDYKDQSHQTLLSASLGYADQYQKPQIIQSEIQRRQQRIQELSLQATPEAIQEVEKEFTHLRQLVSELNASNNALAKQGFEENLRQQQAAGAILRPEDTVFYGEVTTLKRDLLAIDQQEAQFQEGAKAALQAQKQILEQKIAKEKESLAVQNTALRKFSDFGIYNTSGQIKTDYQDKFGNLDPAKVKADQARVIANLRTSAISEDVRNGKRGMTKEELEAQAKLETLIAPTVALQNQQIDQAKQKADIIKAQNETKQAQDRVTSSVQNGTKAFNSYNEELQKTVTNLKNFISLSQKAASPGSVTGRINRENAHNKSIFGFHPFDNKLGDAMASVGEQLVPTNANVPLNALAGKASNLQKDIASLGQSFVVINGIQVYDPKLVAQIRAQLPTYKSAYKEAITTSAAMSGRVTDQSQFANFEKAIDDFDKELARVQAQGIAAANSMGEAQNGMQGFSSTMKSITDNADASTKAVMGLAGGIGTLATVSENSLKQLLGAVGNLNPKAPENKFYGGPIYKAYGGPIGADNIPAWLSNNEYVVNAAATRRFYSQISSMNHMARVPQYFNQGGEVTNMGGITFNISKSDNPQATAREISRMLRRAKRQGSI